MHFSLQKVITSFVLTVFTRFLCLLENINRHVDLHGLGKLLCRTLLTIVGELGSIILTQEEIVFHC